MLKKGEVDAAGRGWIGCGEAKVNANSYVMELQRNTKEGQPPPHLLSLTKLT